MCITYKNTRIAAQKLKPHFWLSKKKVQGLREFLRGILVNVYAKTSGHREGREEAEETS